MDKRRDLLSGLPDRLGICGDVCTCATVDQQPAQVLREIEMPYEIKIDAARKLITVLVTPPRRFEEALACFREIRTHSEFRKEYGVMFNMLAAHRVIPQEEAVQIGEVVKEYFAGQKVAIVVSPSDVDGERKLDFVRTVASIKADARIFNELSGADAWLAG